MCNTQDLLEGLRNRRLSVFVVLSVVSSNLHLHVVHRPIMVALSSVSSSPFTASSQFVPISKMHLGYLLPWTPIQVALPGAVGKGPPVCLKDIQYSNLKVGLFCHCGRLCFAEQWLVGYAGDRTLQEENSWMGFYD